MAAGRWVGRGDKNGGDGAAVDAMRTLIGTVSHARRRRHRRGREGRGADALQRRGGRRRHRPECDVAVDPIDGTTLMAKGMPNAVAVLAVAERGTMFDPSAVFYMEKLAAGPEAADVVDITAPGRREHPPGREGQGRATRGRHRVHPRPARGTRTLVKEVRDAGARIHFISDGDVAGAIMAARAGHRRRPAARHRRHARGHHRRGRAEVHGRRDPGPALAARRRRAAQGARRRPRPRPGADHRRPGQRRQHASSAPPASPTASCCAACATAPTPCTTQSIVHAVQVRHDPTRSTHQHQLGKLRAYSAIDFDRTWPPRCGARQLTTSLTGGPLGSPWGRQSKERASKCPQPVASTVSRPTRWARYASRSDAKWRAQTQRAVENFPISGQPIGTRADRRPRR